MEIYLDNAATTRCYPEAAEAAFRAMTENYGNPSSLHLKGIEAERTVRAATKILADSLKVREKEIYYTSGGTESNNWAIAGTALAARKRGRHLITTAVEHAAVSAPMEMLRELGYEITILPVNRDGLVDPAAVEEAVRPDTILVSVMAVNNEIGAVEPIAEIGERVRRKNPETVFHVDAIQAYGKLELRPKRDHIGLLSVSGHKIHGPKGVGFLFADERVRLKPVIYGGGQQNGMRSGTDNVPGIAGLGTAADIMIRNLEQNRAQMAAVREQLREGLLEIPDVILHGPSDPAMRAPHIVNASFLNVRSEVLLHALEDRGIYVSAGSACSSHKRTGSATLTAVGCSKKELESAVRFSFCETTTPGEITETLRVLKEIIPMLRRFVRA